MRPEILSVRRVVATEKIHGTNFRVHFPEGMASLVEVPFGGRNEDFFSGFALAADPPVVWQIRLS